MYQNGKYTFLIKDYSGMKSMDVTIVGASESDAKTKVTTILGNQYGSWNMSSMELKSYEDINMNVNMNPLMAGSTHSNATGMSTEQWLSSIDSQLRNIGNSLREINDRGKGAKL
jgi:hypothetical protein